MKLNLLVFMIITNIYASNCSKSNEDPCVDEKAYKDGKSIVQGWKSHFIENSDAVVSVGRHVYFFKGDKYIRYDAKTDKVDERPRSISRSWHGMKNFGSKGDFRKNFDAVLYYPHYDAVYFFKGEYYVRYGYKKDRVENGYPKKIAALWKGLPKEGKFDSVIYSPDAIPHGGKRTPVAYFFKGDNYWRYNLDKDRIDKGYPKQILGNWNHLSTSPGAAFYTRDVIKWGGKVTPVMYSFYKKKYYRLNTHKNCLK